MLIVGTDEIAQTFSIALRVARRHKWTHGDTMSAPPSEVGGEAVT